MQEGQLLNQCQSEFPHLHQLIEDMKVYYSDKLWHQLTECILQYIRDEKVLAQGQKLINFYRNFIVYFEKNLDPLKLVRFICRTSEFQGDNDQKIRFMDEIMNKSITDEQAQFICRLKRAEFILASNNFEEVDNTIKEIVSSIRKQANIDPFVHSALYKLGYQYNKIKKNYEELYKYGLQYLAYTSEQDISVNEKYELSLEMAQAILISPTIYNFSELMEQPVLKSLQQSQQGWIFQFLMTYNTGNVNQCLQDMETYKQQIQNMALLRENQTILKEKIRIMAFLDLAFNQPKNQRNLTFQTIAQTSKISLDEVEYLLIRAMALGLVRGKINQIENVVAIDWILPRVLDQQRIKIMNTKLEQWQDTLQGLYQLINSNHSA